MKEKPFPGFEHLYDFSDPLANPPFRGVGNIRGREHAQLLRGESRLIEPIQIHHAMGGRAFDVIWLTSAIVPIVSTRMIDVLREHGFTGWETYPVEVYGKDGVELPGYSGLAVTGRCGPQDYDRSREEMRQFPGGLYPYYIGLYFDEASWDGSDLFVSESGSRVMVVDEVRKALMRAKVRNIRWVQLTEDEMDGSLFNEAKQHQRKMRHASPNADDSLLT